jgi:signal transduction histidine kinase
MIEDNGCGFSLTETGRKSFGNGLANMDRRLKKIGGQFVIAPAGSKGTTITFLMNLAPAAR